MNAKQQYQSAYQMIRSQYNWNLKDTQKTVNAYELAKKMFGETAATAAYNTVCGKQRQFNKWYW